MYRFYLPKCSILAFISSLLKLFLKGVGWQYFKVVSNYQPSKSSASCHLMDAWVWVDHHTFKFPSVLLLQSKYFANR